MTITISAAITNVEPERQIRLALTGSCLCDWTSPAAPSRTDAVRAGQRHIAEQVGGEHGVCVQAQPVVKGGVLLLAAEGDLERDDLHATPDRRVVAGDLRFRAARSAVPAAQDPLENGTTKLLPVPVIAAAPSRLVTGRTIPTRKTEDMCPRGTV